VFKIKPKVVYKDEAGNKLYKKYIPSRDTYQFYAKNRSGKLVNTRGFNVLAKKAGMKFSYSSPTPKDNKSTIIRKGWWYL
jgi:hypothetical protein